MKQQCFHLGLTQLDMTKAFRVQELRPKIEGELQLELLPPQARWLS
jgi:hypothetical protein